jgi:hypothetical protein
MQLAHEQVVRLVAAAHDDERFDDVAVRVGEPTTAGSTTAGARAARSPPRFELVLGKRRRLGAHAAMYGSGARNLFVAAFSGPGYLYKRAKGHPLY